MAMQFMVGGTDAFRRAATARSARRSVPHVKFIQFLADYPSGALLVNVSLVVGEFARTGWLAYPPLSELQYSPGVGVDYHLRTLGISGIGALPAGIANAVEITVVTSVISLS